VAAVRQELDPSEFSENGDVRIVFTGIGSSRAADVVRKCLAERQYRLVVSAGFSGGTRPGLRVGDLVIASEVLEMASGKHWTPAVAVPNESFLKGRLATVDRPLSDPEEKERIGKVHGALAVDMETAAVAASASEAGVPWMALRAILDPMEVPLTVSSWRQGVGSVVNPFRWSDLKELMKGIRIARGSLSRGLNGFVLALRDFSALQKTV